MGFSQKGCVIMGEFLTFVVAILFQRWTLAESDIELYLLVFMCFGCSLCTCRRQCCVAIIMLHTAPEGGRWGAPEQIHRWECGGSGVTSQREYSEVQRGSCGGGRRSRSSRLVAHHLCVLELHDVQSLQQPFFFIFLPNSRLSYIQNLPKNDISRAILPVLCNKLNNYWIGNLIKYFVPSYLNSFLFDSSVHSPCEEAWNCGPAEQEGTQAVAENH